MLSKRGATALSIILSHASFLKVVPFDWNDQKGRLEVVQGVRIYRTIIFGTWVTFLAVFQVSAYILRRGSMSLGQEVLSTLFILVFTLGAGVSLNTFRKRKEFASFSNQFRALQNSLQGQQTLKYLFLHLCSHSQYFRCIFNWGGRRVRWIWIFVRNISDRSFHAKFCLVSSVST